MTKRNSALPRPVAELDALAAYYDTHDTSSEMEDGEWVDPRPMKTTSLRLPADVVEALKAMAHARGMRYTALVREIVEQVINGELGGEREELARIDHRLEKIEKSVAERSASNDRVRERRMAATNTRQQSLTRRKLGRIGSGTFTKAAARSRRTVSR